VRRGERVEPLAGAVGRAVVDEHDLVLVGGERLVQERANAVIDVGARVVHGYHDADLHHGRHPTGGRSGKKLSG